MTADAPALAPLLRALAAVLDLRQPLAVLDLESTGVNPDVDRIVELTVGRIDPDNHVQAIYTRINPGVPIPAEATAVHGITDADVVDAPSFSKAAVPVAALLSGAVLVGYNHRRFDVRMIAAECARAGLDVNPCEGAALIDVGLIFMKREPRTLAAAMQFFCGEDHEDAHGTNADVVATLRVLLSQFERYPDLPRDIAALDAIGRDPSFIDRDGKIVWRGGKACIGFGKHQGVPLEIVERSFLAWMLDKDFPADTKTIVRQALKGTYPEPPAQPVTPEAVAS